ncbi:MAG: hypothetical protein MJE68_19735, partial [Proteobacteria bacterium]|nr:hypothetical protein [Pseudomonadota bacterium]
EDPFLCMKTAKYVLKDGVYHAEVVEPCKACEEKHLGEIPEECSYRIAMGIAKRSGDNPDNKNKDPSKDVSNKGSPKGPIESDKDDPDDAKDENNQGDDDTEDGDGDNNSEEGSQYGDGDSNSEDGSEDGDDSNDETDLGDKPDYAVYYRPIVKRGPIKKHDKGTEWIFYRQEKKGGGGTYYSNLPRCKYCLRVRPLHFPVDCEEAPPSDNERYPCWVCSERNPNHVPDHCPKPDEKKSVEAFKLIVEMRKQLITDNRCPICKEKIKKKKNKHTEDSCVNKGDVKEKVYCETLDRRNKELKVLWTRDVLDGEVEIDPYTGNIIAGLKKCPHCKAKRPLHYPITCIRRVRKDRSDYFEREPCAKCGKEQPSHNPDKCNVHKNDRRTPKMIYFLRREFFDDLKHDGICFICREKLDENHTEYDCLSKISISQKYHSFAGIRKRPDYSVGSGLKTC